MELITGLDWQSASFIMLMSFGAVSAVNFWKKQTPKINFLLSMGFAFIFGFVPADFGNIIANHVKEAIAVALSVNGIYQGLGGIAKKVNL